jgi:hypothetical protein
VAAIGGSGKRKACLLASRKVDASLPNLGSIFRRQLCNVMHKGAAFNDGVVPASSSISTQQDNLPLQLREGALAWQGSCRFLFGLPAYRSRQLASAHSQLGSTGVIVSKQCKNA